METTKSLCDSFYCRLCAEENKNGTHLFTNEENSDDLSLTINRYLPIKVENDGKYPKKICPGCNIQLEATKSFMDLIVEGQTKLRDLYRLQQETLQREEKQRQKLQEALHTVNPNSTVETYTIQSDETEKKFLIQIFSDGPLFPPDHELSLRTQGLEKPKRKRGRPPKQAPEPNIEQEEQQTKSESVENDEEHELDADGRRRRENQGPGKELDKIFQEEGVIDEDDEIAPSDLQVNNDTEEVIGRTETNTGEDLGEPVFNKVRLRLKTGYFSKRKNRRKYQCEVCKREFLHVGRYELHKKSHRIQYACQAPDCEVANEDRAEVDRHQAETGHAGISAVEKLSRCLFEVFMSSASGGALELPDGAEAVEPPAPDASPAQHRCDACDKSFTCKQNLDVHNRAVHNQERPFSCGLCDKTFSYANSLKLHAMRHAKEASAGDAAAKDYPCDVCGKVLQHPSSLLYHKETEHSNGRRFVCNKCDKSFKHRQLLQRHQLVHSDERPYRCSQCDASFKTQANLINHEAVHSGEKKYVCVQCGQRFAHRTSLTLHQRWHEGHKPYNCDVCNKAFSQKGNLAEHRRIHTGEKPYCCDHCGKAFTTSSQFNLHRKRHTGERPWVCEHCSKTFLHKDTFKTHVRRHLNERPFKCKSCPRAFTEAWALKRHERTHSGERPYSCHLCGKTFSDSSNKTKHMRTHNNANNVKRVYRSDGEPEAKQPPEADKADLQLTQLLDHQGNPISITTQDGQTVPVVTGPNDENSIQGLLPDGTLVPIEITTMQEKDLIQNVNEEEVLLCQELQSEMNILKGPDMMKGNDAGQKLDTNIQFITGEDGQEVCLVTYAMEGAGDIGQPLGIDTFLIHDK
ncbi:hypothetical protein NQ318_020196 [Aromia moschata]|uniref:Uncharacterized protein n=1 Tax=Aromia moschata TaxID=1265417 RepID=A0AAV8Z9G5_9CUCU|nr:hypothetical protein NQ318_020196 [Aromia moschata]